MNEREELEAWYDLNGNVTYLPKGSGQSFNFHLVTRHRTLTDDEIKEVIDGLKARTK